MLKLRYFDRYGISFEYGLRTCFVQWKWRNREHLRESHIPPPPSPLLTDCNFRIQFDLLSTWADYLVDNTLKLQDQYSSDLTSKTNSSNVALAGLLGVRAMAGICELLGKSGQEQKYMVSAYTYTLSVMFCPLSSS